MRQSLQYVAKSIAIFSLLLLSSCSGSGERVGTETDPTGLVTFYAKSDAAFYCGDINLTLDGVPIGTITYTPNFAVKCGDFTVPGQVTVRTYVGDAHTFTATSPTNPVCTWTAGIGDINVSAGSCLVEELVY
jgi:hypothetical protein